MKIIFIVNDTYKSLYDTEELNSLLFCIDKVYSNNAFVKFEEISNNEYNATELIDAYNENDFDYYIVSFNTNNANFLTNDYFSEFIIDNKIKVSDVLVIMGLKSFKEQFKDIKNFIKN